jgi:hypothetical protein
MGDIGAEGAAESKGGLDVVRQTTSTARTSTFTKTVGKVRQRRAAEPQSRLDIIRQMTPAVTIECRTKKSCSDIVTFSEIS